MTESVARANRRQWLPISCRLKGTDQVRSKLDVLSAGDSIVER